MVRTRSSLPSSSRAWNSFSRREGAASAFGRFAYARSVAQKAFERLVRLRLVYFADTSERNDMGGSTSNAAAYGGGVGSGAYGGGMGLTGLGAGAGASAGPVRRGGGRAAASSGGMAHCTSGAGALHAACTPSLGCVVRGPRSRGGMLGNGVRREFRPIRLAMSPSDLLGVIKACSRGSGGGSGGEGSGEGLVVPTPILNWASHSVNA